MTRQLFAAAAAALAVAGCNPSSGTKATTVSSGSGTATTQTTDTADTGTTKTTEVHTADTGTKATGEGNSGIRMPNSTDIMAGKNEFRIATHTLFGSPTVKQGEKHELKITLKRGSDYKDDVALTAEGGKGLKVDFPDANRSADEKEDVAMNVTVDKDAPLGKQDIKVTGKGKNGTTHTATITLNVEASVAKK